MTDKPKFDSKLRFDLKSKLCKVYKYKDRNEKAYYMGNLTKTTKIHIQENTYKGVQPGEFQVSIIPIEFKKVEDNQAPPEAQDKDGFDYESNRGYVGPATPPPPTGGEL